MGSDLDCGGSLMPLTRDEGYWDGALWVYQC